MNKQTGFTMIELVVVIVILGILAAMSIPKFLDLTDEAKQAVCDANAGSINAALSIAYTENAVNGLAVYPDNIDGSLFAENVAPLCPFGWVYGYVSVNGYVTKHVHLP